MNRLSLPLFASIVASFACLVVALPAAAGPFAYVANKDSDDVSIVDVATATEMERLPVVDKPKGVATNASRTKLVVANDRYLSVFDLTDLNVPRVDIDLGIGDATDVIVDPMSERAWVSYKDWGELTEVSLRTMRPVAQITTGLLNVRHLTLSPVSDDIYGVSQLGSVMQMPITGIPQARKIAHEVAPIPSDIFATQHGTVLVGSVSNGNVLSFPEPGPGAMASTSVVESGYNPGGLSAHSASAVVMGPIVARPDDDAIETAYGQIQVAPNTEPTWVRTEETGDEFLAVTLENDPSGVSAAGDGSLLIMSFMGDSYAPVGNDPRDLEIDPRMGPRMHTTPGDLKFGSNVAFGPRTNTLHVRSTGDEALRISSFRIWGPDAGDFRVSMQNCTGRGLDFQDTCDVRISFSPSPKVCTTNPWLKLQICAPTYSATLEIESNAGEAAHTVLMRGGLFVEHLFKTLEARPTVGTRLNLSFR